MATLPADIDKLLRSLHQPRSLLDRLAGDPRRDYLAKIGAACDFRVVPALLPLLAASDALTEEVARTIVALLRAAGPAELVWVDEQARRWFDVPGDGLAAWRRLSAGAIPALGRALRAYPAALGLLASHPDGFVREAVVNELAALTDGHELPFLTLRANDWVPPVAARANALLARRLVPENRPAVLLALPFLVRLAAQGRHDHRRLIEALGEVLGADGGGDVLARMHAYNTSVRRFVYDRLLPQVATVDDAALRTALTDGAASVRRSAVRRLLSIDDLDASAEVLEHLVRGDRMPSVRKEALAILAQRLPARLPGLLRRALLDAAARVRELARFIVRDRHAPIVPRDVYVECLATPAAPRQLIAAIDGLGETGTSADLHLLDACSHSSSPRVRRARLRAGARLDAARAIAWALAALDDRAPSVRSAAVTILRNNAPLVDFPAVNERMKAHADPRAREALLSLLAEAQKWDAAAFLFEALADANPSVRAKAASFLDAWIARFNQSQPRPTPSQLQRIRALLAANASQISTEMGDLLRLSLKGF